MANVQREKEVLLFTNKQLAKELAEAWIKNEQLESELIGEGKKRYVLQTSNDKLKHELENTRRTVNMMRGLFKNALSPAQMNFVFDGTKVNRWHDEDMRHVLALRNLSPKAHRFLKG